ncbi:MAG: ribulose-phosphate 3-epimerase [Bacteroidota bacterium]|jgi:ribulose-phosphate 3-epimerase|nr:ribulose-phosphate 3-epimerase [Ignavibacteria bacterium]MCU7500769.1 ribulose-phosphate 3-epimerase [Ignavibacteria bacterium]MCU7514279.1 ribulose-phosphate 3-epimerase [Ignavibacteria bacterium]MCU7522407.1 ribulose-phosphate 3-epimerase [Ignavibacteria bacterium]MCU7525588.1 ribulose-phosphate 3-epimerase [Ignavibacteria bacterium]
MKLISPSILNADFSRLADEVALAERGGADWVHCDIMDGHFVPNISFGPFIVKTAKKITKLPLDVHLMIENPDLYIEDFLKSGADIVTVHQEAVVHLNRTIQHIKGLGARAGVSINPSTPVSTLREIAEFVDMVLIMSVNPGFGGQSFIESSLRKIRETVRLREEMNANFLIEVDGGISSENIQKISDAGADVFVVGSAIFKSGDIPSATAELKNIVNTRYV